MSETWFEQNGPDKKPDDWRHEHGNVWTHLPSGVPWILKEVAISFSRDEITAEEKGP